MLIFFSGALLGCALGILDFVPWLHATGALLRALEAMNTSDSQRGMIIYGGYLAYGIGNIVLAALTGRNFIFGLLFGIPSGPMISWMLLINLFSE